MKQIIDRLRGRNAAANPIRTVPGMEPVYRDLFLRELARCGVADTFYPVGPAANHSMMYFIARVLQDHRFTSVLDLGAGQTSILIDRIRGATTGAYSVRTVEHDRFWAERIGAQIGHEVIAAPLVRRNVQGRDIGWYDLPPAIWKEPADLLIVDGPPGYDENVRYARTGAVEIAASVLKEDFVVVVDDSERVGEYELVQLLKALFRARGVAFASGTLHAYKCQTILAAGKYRDAAYF